MDCDKFSPYYSPLSISGLSEWMVIAEMSLVYAAQHKYHKIINNKSLVSPPHTLSLQASLYDSRDREVPLTEYKFIKKV